MLMSSAMATLPGPGALRAEIARKMFKASRVALI